MGVFTPTQRLHQTEFIALMAMLAATVAFSIDAMLPAMPEIGAELSPDALNNAQLVVTTFVLGMGLGTFVTGPLSDRFGRRPVMIGGACLYVAGCVVATLAQSIEVLLAARLIQGLGGSGPRVVAVAMIRDQYKGPQMASIVSFVMLVFSLVPAMAPTIGHYIILGYGWRGIFVAFMVFSILTCLWLIFRQPETLCLENRRPLSPKALGHAIAEMFRHRTARLSIFTQALTMAMLFTVLSTTQQVFDLTFDQGGYFHLWFGGIAVLAASSSLINAHFVVRIGMRAIIRKVYAAQIAVSAIMILMALFGATSPLYFGIYVLWVAANFFQAGLTIGNLNALAMEEMGHIAGLAASVIAAVSTVGAVILAVPVALAFDGTPLPMTIGALIWATLALWLSTMIKRPGDA